MTEILLLEKVIKLRKSINQKTNVVYTWNEIAEITGEAKEKCRAAYRRWKRLQEDAAPADDPECTVIGVTPEDYKLDPEEIWDRAFDKQDKNLEFWQRRRNGQRIIVKPPCAWALLSDQHLDDPMADVRSAKRDAEIIRDTPGMFAGHHGDYFNNWIIGKLVSLQRNQSMTFDESLEMVFDYIKIVGPKLKYVVSGNHDNWTLMLSGFDAIRNALDGCKLLYHTDQIVFTLQVGDYEYPVKVRHKWPYGSVFNTTHSIEVGWERGGDDFIFGVGGHTHQGTYFRPFTRHGVRRYAILTGTYKIGDSYGEKLGFAPPANSGCGAIVFDRDGSIFGHYEDLEKAAFTLRALQSE